MTFWSKLIARRDPVQGDSALVQALRDGDEEAFTSLVDAYSDSMRRLALTFVRTRAVADEVVQEAWLGVLKGIDRFEGRSSLKTWIFRITANVAKTRAEREARSVPFSSLEPQGDEPSVDPDRFFKPGESGPTGGWSSPPESWQALPEERLLSAETRLVIQRAIDDLPPSQRVVITLRDVAGPQLGRGRNVLDLVGDQSRVLLHRARSKFRARYRGLRACPRLRCPAGARRARHRLPRGEPLAVGPRTLRAPPRRLPALHRLRRAVPRDDPADGNAARAGRRARRARGAARRVPKLEVVRVTLRLLASR